MTSPEAGGRAYQWWCGIDYCDCTQYVIETGVKTSWEGRFQSPSWQLPRSECAEDLRAFRNAARMFGIPLTRSGLGWGGLAPVSVEAL